MGHLVYRGGEAKAGLFLPSFKDVVIREVVDDKEVATLVFTLC